MANIIKLTPLKMGQVRRLTHLITPTWGLSKAVDYINKEPHYGAIDRPPAQLKVEITQRGLRHNDQVIEGTGFLARRLQYHGVESLLLDNINKRDLKATLRSVTHRLSAESIAKKVEKFGIDVIVEGFGTDQDGLMEICRAVSEKRMPVTWHEVSDVFDSKFRIGWVGFPSGIISSIFGGVYAPRPTIGAIAGGLLGSIVPWLIGKAGRLMMSQICLNRLKELYENVAMDLIPRQKIVSDLKFLRNLEKYVTYTGYVIPWYSVGTHFRQKVQNSLPLDYLIELVKVDYLLIGQGYRDYDKSLADACLSKLQAVGKFHVSNDPEDIFSYIVDHPKTSRDDLLILARTEGPSAKKAFSKVEASLTPAELLELAESRNPEVVKAVVEDSRTPRIAKIFNKTVDYREIRELNIIETAKTLTSNLTKKEEEYLKARLGRLDNQIKLILLPHISVTLAVDFFVTWWGLDPIGEHWEERLETIRRDGYRYWDQEDFVYDTVTVTVTDYGYSDETVDKIIKALKQIPQPKREKIISGLKWVWANNPLYNRIKERQGIN